MNAVTFYEYYGRHIARVQQNPARKTLSAWPYINPTSLKADIAIRESELKKFFVPCGIHYDWYLSSVVYRAGMITYAPLPYGPYAAISFEFSGCYMAKLCFRGDWYVFHISTDETRAYDRKKEWKDFLSRYKQDISTLVMCQPTTERALFNKWTDLRFNYRLPVTLACLIAEDNQCYTLVYDYDSARVEEEQGCCFHTDYIRKCTPKLLCHDADLDYFTRLMNKNKLWVDSGAERKTARRP